MLESVVASPLPESRSLGPEGVSHRTEPYFAAADSSPEVVDTRPVEAPLIDEKDADGPYGACSRAGSFSELGGIDGEEMIYPLSQTEKQQHPRKQHLPKKSAPIKAKLPPLSVEARHKGSRVISPPAAIPVPDMMYYGGLSYKADGLMYEADSPKERPINPAAFFTRRHSAPKPTDSIEIGGFSPHVR